MRLALCVMLCHDSVCVCDLWFVVCRGKQPPSMLPGVTVSDHHIQPFMVIFCNILYIATAN